MTKTKIIKGFLYVILYPALFATWLFIHAVVGVYITEQSLPAPSTMEILRGLAVAVDSVATFIGLMIYTNMTEKI